MDRHNYGRKKDRRKIRRVIVQCVLVISMLLFLGYSTVALPMLQQSGDGSQSGQAPDRLALDTSLSEMMPGAQAVVPVTTAGHQITQREQGFVAISYVGVGPQEGETVINNVRLNKHLRALYERGFVTISQQDIYDYYLHGKALPERALFLFFEDGRMQSAKLAHPILKEYQFKANMISYANNLEDGDPLFLTADELKALENSGLWEMGTNGYRLSYINVFDRHKNYLGEMTPLEYYFISPYVRREYNHYLMDFIRDKNLTPMESYDQMRTRVEADYTMMNSVYSSRIGKLPGLYVLMHSNTGQFGTNSTVSSENEKWIRQYFTMNFNREMLSVNRLEDNIYDLTRMQPQSYWSVNHLLMRIYHDSDLIGILPFELGDKERAMAWDIQQGAAEFDGNTIRVTSLPEGEGRIRLTQSEGLGDFTLETRLDGNMLGKQAIELLADAQAMRYTAVELEKNILRVYEGVAGQPYIAQEGLAPLFELNLDNLDGLSYQTWEQNRQEAMGVEIDRKLLQTYMPVESKAIAADLMRAKADTSQANHEPFIPEISLKDDGSRLLRMERKGGGLSLWIDGKPVAQNLQLAGNASGGLALRSAWMEHGYSQRNLADDVYDADFTNLYITNANGTNVVLDYRGPEEVVQATATDEPIASGQMEAEEPVEEANAVVRFFQSTKDWFVGLFD